MNEAIILEMVKPYLKDGKLTYKEFDSIFDMLTLKEQYAVVEILFKNSILLEDEKENGDDEHNTEESILAEIGSTDNDFEVLYDESLFEDSEDEEQSSIAFMSHTINQSNEVLCGLIQQGNKEAESDLCIKNSRLVDKCVSRYMYLKGYGNRLEFDDLKQVGFMGLIRAAKKYNPAHDARFTTYAVWWINQAISREIMDHGYAIRIPVHMMERIVKVSTAEHLYEGESVEARVRKVAEQLNLSKEQVKECIMLRDNYLKYVSIDIPVGEDGDTELAEFIPEEDEKSVEEIVEEHALAWHLIEEINEVLTPKEKDIIIKRFGLGESAPMTLEEIGEIYNLTRERIRQVESKALRKLKYSRRARMLEGYATIRRTMDE